MCASVATAPYVTGTRYRTPLPRTAVEQQLWRLVIDTYAHTLATATTTTTASACHNNSHVTATVTRTPRSDTIATPPVLPSSSPSSTTPSPLTSPSASASASASRARRRLLLAPPPSQPSQPQLQQRPRWWTCGVDAATAREWLTARVAALTRYLAQTHVVLGAGVVDVAVQHPCAALRYELVRVLLTYRHWCFDACAPVAVAVACGDVDVLELLMRDRRVDVNVACPLCVAVRTRQHAMLQRLLSHCPRIDVNYGNAFFVAVAVMRDAAAAALLGAQHGVDVNDTHHGDGTTALLHTLRAFAAAQRAVAAAAATTAAVAAQTEYAAVADAAAAAADADSTTTTTAVAARIRHETAAAAVASCRQMLHYLLAHAAVDVNAGYAYTPLQAAVCEDSVEAVSLLLQHPRLRPNQLAASAYAVASYVAKASSPSRQQRQEQHLPDRCCRHRHRCCRSLSARHGAQCVALPALCLAVVRRRPRLVSRLLRDRRVRVPPSLLPYLDHNPAAMWSLPYVQRIAHYRDVYESAYWTWRRVCVYVSTVADVLLALANVLVMLIAVLGTTATTTTTTTTTDDADDADTSATARTAAAARVLVTTYALSSVVAVATYACEARRWRWCGGSGDDVLRGHSLARLLQRYVWPHWRLLSSSSSSLPSLSSSLSVQRPRGAVRCVHRCAAFVLLALPAVLPLLDVTCAIVLALLAQRHVVVRSGSNSSGSCRSRLGHSTSGGVRVAGGASASSPAIIVAVDNNDNDDASAARRWRVHAPPSLSSSLGMSTTTTRTTQLTLSPRTGGGNNNHNDHNSHHNSNSSSNSDSNTTAHTRRRRVTATQVVVGGGGSARPLYTYNHNSCNSLGYSGKDSASTTTPSLARGSSSSSGHRHAHDDATSVVTAPPATSSCAVTAAATTAVVCSRARRRADDDVVVNDDDDDGACMRYHYDVGSVYTVPDVWLRSLLYVSYEALVPSRLLVATVSFFVHLYLLFPLLVTTAAVHAAVAVATAAAYDIDHDDSHDNDDDKHATWHARAHAALPLLACVALCACVTSAAALMTMMLALRRAVRHAAHAELDDALYAQDDGHYDDDSSSRGGGGAVAPHVAASRMYVLPLDELV